jgi:hypothetical protein
MKSPILALAFFGILAVISACAQEQPRDPALGSAQPNSLPGRAAGAPAAAGDRVVKAESGLPDLRPAGDLKPPAIDLPDEPVEAYLLTKDVGPYMVFARVFRGKDAERTALALVKELRTDFGLPAFILRTKDFPGVNQMRGAAASGPAPAMAPAGKLTAKTRTFAEAAVFIGDEKTPAAQEKLLREIKNIHPKCLEGVSTPFWWRTGLSSAFRVTNPYMAVRQVSSQANDRLVVRMNSGLRSIANCPGRYSLQVADFSGRTAFQLNPNVAPTQLLPNLNSSPLRKAADDAERMADKLSKAPEIQRLGLPIYVFHDRTTSKVFVGSFNDPRDPAAAALRNQLVHDAYEMSNKDKRGKAATDTMIVPALALTDLSEIKSTLKN